MLYVLDTLIFSTLGPFSDLLAIFSFGQILLFLTVLNLLGERTMKNMMFPEIVPYVRLGNLKQGHLEMGGKLRNIVKYTSTYQSKALLLLFRMVIIGAMIDDHIVVVFPLE